MGIIHKRISIRRGGMLAPNHIPINHLGFESWGHMFQVSKEGLLDAIDNGYTIIDTHTCHRGDRNIGLFSGYCYKIRNNEMYEYTNVLESCRSLIRDAVCANRDTFKKNVRLKLGMTDDDDAEAFFQELASYVSSWGSSDYEHIFQHHAHEIPAMFDIIIQHTVELTWEVS